MPIRPSALNEPTTTIKAQSSQERKIQETRKDIEAKEILKSEEAYQKGIITVRDLVAPAALRVDAKYLQLGDQYLRTIFVTTFPRYVMVGWFSPIIHLNAPLDIAMFFYPVESKEVLKQLLKKVGNLEVEIQADREKTMPRDPVKETALQDIEKLRDDLTTGVEHFFQLALYVTIYANDLKALDLLTERVETIFGGKMVYTRRVLYQSEQGFNSTLPLANDEMMTTVNMSSSPCASSFPFISADLTSDSGVLYGINRHNNSLILFDRFSMPNANFTVFATSGSGKSYFAKLEVLRSLMLGTDVIIIDPEREYKHLCDAVGGTYVNISLTSESKINPFDLPRASSQDVKTSDLIRSAVITLKGLLKICIGKPDERGNLSFTPEEDSLIDRALIESYAKKDIVPGCDLSRVEMPIMSDLQEILEGMEGGNNLAERLKKYTIGTFSGFLNNPTNVQMDNKLVIFSVRIWKMN
ncbi:MAG: DUF87 domain-containing protein [Patescibacteria group bacterium]|jgi:type IV secretory pathway VirB4 component